MQSLNFITYVILAFVVVLTCCAVWILYILFHWRKRTNSKYNHEQKKDKKTSCSVATCGALDPVSDPAYNMRQIAGQCILLEEHLTDNRKYCKDCILKHLIHKISLCSEALMLAGNQVTKYPMMSDLEDFFEAQLKSWLDTENAHLGTSQVDLDAKEANRLDIATAIRVKRKELVEIYYLGAFGPDKQY
jgi:hypothetical protein